MKIVLAFCIISLCTVLTVAFEFTYSSVKGHIFETIRPKTPPKVFTECEKNVTAPYGVLVQNYALGPDRTCNFYIHAPKNYVVHVISVFFELLDEIKDDTHKSETSRVELYDVIDGQSTNLNLDAFVLDPYDASHSHGHIIQATSTQNDMMVKINYKNPVGYNKLNIRLTYEFLEKQKMFELLRAYSMKQ